MSLTDDLALVTACRDATDDNTFVARLLTPALSLIEDILNDYAPVAYPDGPVVPDYARAVTALRTIATALGVEVPA